MSTSLIPDNWRIHLGNQVLESITEPCGNNSYYLFVTEHVTRLETILPDALDDPQQIYVDVYHNMIEGKRLNNTDVCLVIRNIPYAVGYYDMYDDGDPELADKDYYAITNNGSYYHVWKVLDNNNGANSSIAPDFSNIDINDEVYQTSDGYRWKYIYSVDSATVSKFATPSYFPCVANNEVAAAAKQGAIDIIQVKETGRGYDNYLISTFTTGDLRVNGNNTIYSISANSMVQPANGFYTGCLLYVSAGAGIGQYKMITDYFTNANGNFMVLESEFLVPPQNGDAYEIYPSLDIVGDGRQTINAVARALINSVGNAVYRVEMMSRGANYRYASANVVANAIVGVIQEANVRPIYGPPGGHGYDASLELRATGICFSMALANTEANTIPATNQFQQYGIMRDPHFSNVEVRLVAATPNPFIVGETVYKFSGIFLGSNAQVNSLSATITMTNGHFDQQLSNGSAIYLKSETANSKMLGFVNSVINSSAITLTVNALFDDDMTEVYLANLEGNAVVLSHPASNIVFISNLSSQWKTGDIIIGGSSGGYGEIHSTYLNDVATNFGTFVGMYRYAGSYNLGTFIQNEKVYEGANLSHSTANASIHSAVSNGSTMIVYVSNQVGVFSNTLIGADSGATFSFVDSYSPDIDFGSGRVLYIENISAVPRTESTTEHFNIVFQL